MFKQKSTRMNDKTTKLKIFSLFDTLSKKNQLGYFFRGNAINTGKSADKSFVAFFVKSQVFYIFITTENFKKFFL